MYRVTCMNLKTGAKFDKFFDSAYICRQYINKCKHSKEVKIVFQPNL